MTLPVDVSRSEAFSWFFYRLFVCPFRGHDLEMKAVLWDTAWQCKLCGLVDWNDHPKVKRRASHPESGKESK